MGLLLLSFIAGVLTIIAPCVLPILPVLLGGSVVQGEKSRPRVIILSFAISVLVFTLSLQWLVNQFGLQLSTISMISGWILVAMGTFFLFPGLRQWFMEKTGIESATSSAVGESQGGLFGDIITGAILGPVFNTCSPTFLILVSNVLPQSYTWGLINILVYILGLCLVLSLILWGGRAAIKKLRRFANPRGIFKKVIAILLIFVGVAILFKWDKQFEAYLLTNGLTLDTTAWEYELAKDYRK